MIAVALIGGISLALLQLTKTQSRTSVQAKVDADISQMKTEIQSMLSKANSCNANFAGKAPATSYFPLALYDCNTATPGTVGGCATGELGTSVIKPALTADTYVAAPPLKLEYSDKLRVTKLTIYIDPVSAVAGQDRILTNATLTVETIAKYLANNGETLPTYKKTPTFTFFATVVYDRLTNKVIGCPKVWNSTLYK